EEERRDGLQIELARVWPSGGAADGEPLLGEHAEEELLREVARHHAGPGLYLALAGELRGRGGKDEGRPGAEDPVPRVRGREQLQQAHVAQPGGALELAGGRLVRDDVVEGHHRARDEVQVPGQALWQHRLEVPVVVPVAIRQFKVIKLVCYRPQATHWIGELPVQFTGRLL